MNKIENFFNGLATGLLALCALAFVVFNVVVCTALIYGSWELTEWIPN